MSRTKVNISWKQSPCYTCACLLKVPIPPFQWWYRFVSTKRVALLISGKNDENPVFRGRFLSSVLERKESLPGCDIQRNTFLPLLVSSAFGKCGNHGWRWANSGEQGWRWTTKQSGGSRMNPELSGSNRRLSLCIFSLLVLLPIGRGKDLAQARTITAQYIFLIWAIVAEPWPIGRQWQGGLSPAALSRCGLVSNVMQRLNTALNKPHSQHTKHFLGFKC